MFGISLHQWSVYVFVFLTIVDTSGNFTERINVMFPSLISTRAHVGVCLGSLPTSISLTRSQLPSALVLGLWPRALKTGLSMFTT